MRHVFLVNPAAGQQDQTARFTAMADSLHRRHSLNCTLLRTDGPGSAEAAARPSGANPESRCGCMSAAETARPMRQPAASPGFPTRP